MVRGQGGPPLASEEETPLLSHSRAIGFTLSICLGNHRGRSRAPSGTVREARLPTALPPWLQVLEPGTL